MNFLSINICDCQVIKVLSPSPTATAYSSGTLQASRLTSAAQTSVSSQTREEVSRSARKSSSGDFFFFEVAAEQQLLSDFVTTKECLNDYGVQCNFKADTKMYIGASQDG